MKNDPDLLSTRRVMGRYGVCGRTIERWLADDSRGFPRPLKISRRRFWMRSELEDWEQGLASQRL